MSASEAVSAITSENEPIADDLESAAVAHSGDDDGPVVATPMAALRRLAVQGSIWTMIGFAIGEIIRFGGHLLVAALVLPDVFGIMALVTVFMTGLQMFSDIGIGPSIVQDRRGDDVRFLNTAWTIQVVRGFGLAVATVALAYPFSQYYYHDLYWLLPVAAIGPLISGFNSTSLASLHRKLSIGKLTLFELATSLFRALAAVGFVLMIPKYPALALIIGNLCTEAVRLALSHTVFGQDRKRFTWDRDAARRLFRFGRWIFIATALTFFIGSGDKLILGRKFEEAELGVYMVAFMYAEAVPSALKRLAHMVLFPLYARLSEHEDGILQREMFRMRAILMALTLPPLWFLAIFGSQMIKWLPYKPDYYPAGWILQILAMGTIVSSMAMTLSPVVLSLGNSFLNMVLLITRSILLVAAMLVGYHFFDKPGLVIGFAITSALNYPVLVLCVRKYGAWTPWLDLSAIAISALIITIGLLIVGLPAEWGQFS